jgi:hypothetical protein
MQRLKVCLLVSMLALALAPAASASLMSKQYQFKPGVQLELGAASDDGLRLDAVLFELPSPSGVMFFRKGTQFTVEVAVSNTAEFSQKIGVAVALFDDGHRLVGATSGGSKMLAIRPGGQKIYKMKFENVNGEAYKAKTFLISIESKP